MPLLQVLRPTLPILIGASLMLTLSMGLRQSLGIFMQPLTHDVGISVSEFTLAIAVQNGLAADQAIVDSGIAGLGFIPSGQRLAGAEVELVDAERREYRLKDALAPLDDRYEYILIDAPPSLGLLTVNALTAANSVLVPVQRPREGGASMRMYS